MNKKELNQYQLQDYSVSEYKILTDENTDYLTKAFILPEKQFLKEMVKFSTNDGFVNVEGMQEKLKVKNIVARGRDLKIW